MRDGLGLGREPDESHNGCGSQNRGRPLGSVVITVSSSAEDFLLIPFVENAFAKFGPAGELRELFMVGDTIGYAALSLELRDKDRQAVESDVAALTFHGSPNVKSPWGTYFRPRSSEPQPDQTTIDSPDIRRLDAESVERWKQRARATDDPVIKARFADVVWDLERAITGGRGRSVEFATMAVNGYLSTVSEQRNTAKRRGASRYSRRGSGCCCFCSGNVRRPLPQLSIAGALRGVPVPKKSFN